jgi:hypothetical protein
MPRGRPPLTEDAVQERIAEYCSRYAVTERNESEFPVYPSGTRESAQHREWVVLYKAWSRARQRAAIAGGGEDVSAKAGSCPICLLAVGPARATHLASPGPAVMHPRCRQFLVIAEELGSAALERAKRYLATIHQGSGRPGPVD